MEYQLEHHHCDERIVGAFVAWYSGALRRGGTPFDQRLEGKHWPILYLNWSLNESNDYIFEANPTRSAIFKIS